MADSCLSLAVLMFALYARDQGSMPHWGTEVFSPQNLLLHFVPNKLILWSIVWMVRSMKIWFPRRWLNVTMDSCIGGLTPAWNLRDWDLIPGWGVEFLFSAHRNPLEIVAIDQNRDMNSSYSYYDTYDFNRRKKQFILFLSSQSAKSGHQNLFIYSV